MHVPSSSRPTAPAAATDAPLSTSWADSQGLVPRKIVQPLTAFLHTEVASGLVLLGAALVALVWANSPWASVYERLWTTPFTVALGPLELSEDLRHWVNDGLMAVFFFIVGLEIKRELVLGELRDRRAAALPLVCAVGGMVVPAGLYALLNVGGPGSAGWGVPMATDIAFAVGVLALVGSRAPAGLKVFLLTLAIVDDLGAIAVIALFYSSGLSAQWLAGAAAVATGIVLMRRLRVRAAVPYAFAAGLLWLTVYSSGVHATIAGVIFAFLTPVRPFHLPEAVSGVAVGHLQRVHGKVPDGIADEDEQASLLEVSRLTNEAVSPLARLEARWHPWSSFLVLPLFALANAGVELYSGVFREAVTEPVVLGIVVGLVLGKPLGIVAAAALAVRLRLSRLPPGMGWLELSGVGLLAGVGFTVAIFIAGLAFTDPERVAAAKVGILVASLLAGGLGALALAVRDAGHRPPPG